MPDLQPILRRYPRDCQPTHVESLGSAGGLSGARFWRLSTPRGTLAVRRWPIEHPTPDGLRFVHAVLRHAADRGIRFLPLPIATVDGATFVSHVRQLWELTPWLPGRADYQESPSVPKLRVAMSALAEFHVATADFHVSPPLASSLHPSPAITSRLARLHELQSGGSETLARSIADSHWPELAPLARRFVTTLPRVVPGAIQQLAPLADARFALQPCIRDVWHDHVLFDGDRVTGLIDFGAIEIDTLATDVARLLGSLVDDEAGWRDGLAAYSAVRPLSEREVAAVAPLDASGTILAGANWLRWIYVEKRQFEDRQQVLLRFVRILDRLSRS